MSNKEVLTSNEENKQKTLTNIRYVIFYALSLTVALGFNDLITTIFNSFSYSHNIISKITYVVIMFGITLFVAFWLSDTIKV